MGKGAGFSGSGTGYNHKRASRISNCLRLFMVKIATEITINFDLIVGLC